MLTTLKSYAQKVVSGILDEAEETELDRIAVAGALVARDQDHYRIEAGGDEWSDLEDAAQRAAGLCDCGKPLSRRESNRRCRSCGREYRSL
ncbi:MAG: hypothetical protein VX614_05190 [Myxococcota bacterium]|nr:hypothetical protein [Myxococcota bacterium]